MREPAAETPFTRAATLVALLAAAVLVLRLATTWAGRLAYPYDLEWMEGGMLAHAWRLQQGDGLYVLPSADFTPFIYPPAYPALLAALGLPLGLSPALGRSVSLLGSLAAAGSLLFLVRRLTHRTAPALLAAATFLGTYAASGAFLDLVRPDGLFLGLLSWSIALAFVPGRRALIGCALLLVAAFFVKHNAAFFGPALMLGMGMREPRDALRFAAWSVLPSLIGIAWLQWSSGGLFWTYLVSVPTSHPIVWSRVFPGALGEVATALPLTTVALALTTVASSRQRHPNGSAALWVGLPLIAGLALAWVGLAVAPSGASRMLTGLGIGAIGVLGAHAGLRLMREPRSLSGHWVLGAALAVTALLGSLWMRGHSGGFLNVHLPAFWFAALGAGLIGSALPSRFAHAAPLLLGVQLFLLAWTTPFDDLVPDAVDRDAGDRLVRTLKTLDGPIWSPDAAWLPTYAGHDPRAHRMGLWDLEGSPLEPHLDGVRAAIAAQEFGAIVTSQRPLRFGVDRHYRLRTRLHHNGALAPKTGWKVELGAILIPGQQL